MISKVRPLIYRVILGGHIACMSIAAPAQDNRIDLVRHDAPELAHFGEYDIGVRTLEFIDPNRPDVLNTQVDEDNYHDRKLIVEVWYPAVLAPGQKPGGSYTTTTRNLDIIATLHGRAVRKAMPINATDAFPLIIVSHGWPGNRYLMSHMGENLASKGYIVASIDHPDSVYENHQPIWSTLYHRPLDQLFVLEQMDRLSQDAASFLQGLVDAKRTGIVGYSMGGYGLLINLGAGYSESVVNSENAPPNGLATRHAASNPDFANEGDPRIKAGVAVAACCMARGVWNPEDLESMTTPTLYMSGSLDGTAGYAEGTRAIFENATGSDRYLLTFENAGHNAIAPIPLPVEIHESDDQAGAFHYTDAVWDSIRSANIMNHFATVFFDLHLKGNAQRSEFLELVPNSSDGVYSMEDGRATSEHSYWKGFPQYTARGLLLEHRRPVE